MTRRRRGGVKRRENNLASNQFPKCYPQPRTPKKIQRGREEKGEGGDRGDVVEKKESQKTTVESRFKSMHFGSRKDRPESEPWFHYLRLYGVGQVTM